MGAMGAVETVRLCAGAATKVAVVSRTSGALPRAVPASWQ
jgi:hypothetical protein